MVSPEGGVAERESGVGEKSEEKEGSRGNTISESV